MKLTVQKKEQIKNQIWEEIISTLEQDDFTPDDEMILIIEIKENDLRE